MKNEKSTKLFISSILVLLLLISALIGLVLWPIKVELYAGMKTLHLVAKIFVLVIFAIHIVLCLLPQAHFSSKIVQTAFVLLLQLMPLITRIKFKSNAAPIVILLFALVIFTLFYFGQGLSAKKFHEDEDRAKPSSNYKG